MDEHGQKNMSYDDFFWLVIYLLKTHILVMFAMLLYRVMGNLPMSFRMEIMASQKRSNSALSSKVWLN